MTRPHPADRILRIAPEIVAGEIAAKKGDCDTVDSLASVEHATSASLAIRLRISMRLGSARERLMRLNWSASMKSNDIQITHHCILHRDQPRRT